MKKDKIKIKKVHLTLGILAVVFIVSLLIIAPFISAILSAYVLAFLIFPFFKILNKSMNKTLSALLCIVIILGLIIIPLFFIVNQIINETIILSENINITNITNGFSGPVQKEVIPILTSYISNFTGKLIHSLPSVIITLLVTFFGVFYFLYDWENFNSFLYRKAPIENKKKFFEDVALTTKKITYGLLIVAAIEFAVAFIGFTISGIKFPLLLATIIGILAFTLVIDSSVVWVPVALIYLLVLHKTSSAIGVIITGLIISTDMFFRPKIIGSVSKINPFLMLLGVLGGIALFGILGFIIGPIVLFFAIRLFKESFELEEK
jgi:predicted PurR-regulated permease PerM